jgi:helix-turn-helix protein
LVEETWSSPLSLEEKVLACLRIAVDKEVFESKGGSICFNLYTMDGKVHGLLINQLNVYTKVDGWLGGCVNYTKWEECKEIQILLAKANHIVLARTFGQ